MAKASGAGYHLQNARTGEILAHGLEGAFTASARRRGLLGRSVFAPGAGLLIAPCSAIHTVGMQFPIDVIFVSRSGRIRKIVSHVRPWQLAFGLGSFAVVELPAGVVDGSDTQRGDTLTIRPAHVA